MFDTNWAVQSMKMIRGLKFGIKEVDGLYMYFLYSEDKNTDQLPDYRAAEFRLGFGMYKKLVSYDTAHNYVIRILLSWPG